LSEAANGLDRARVSILPSVAHSAPFRDVFLDARRDRTLPARAC